ncbi:MAG: methylmalonyl Co-A mutase-associated GTPase MeaB [Ectothiorhodospiraceae bacterium]|nr:methylmalonyl Co-A mutase-associated GTPase MeaB [Ectothiorhodospiraceae bacterium]
MSISRGVEQPTNTAASYLRKKRTLTVDEHVEGIRAGDRVILGRTITLIESSLPEHHAKALEIVERIMPDTGNAVRIGITGVPGVGKSTFIESFGQHAIAQGRRVAVLAIDPSSEISGGSIMGDKTRMEKLSGSDAAFIRPSPSAGSLGGVARKTREVMLLCEAAGYDIVFIETVGVGQSETMVHGMVDFFLLLMLAGAGDEMQGIKKGIIELADAMVIHKADGDNVHRAMKAKEEFSGALHYLRPQAPGWTPPVLTASSLTGEGITDVWETMTEFHDTMTANGYIAARRRKQAVNWLHETIQHSLRERFLSDPSTAERLPLLEREVQEGTTPPLAAAATLLKNFFDEEIDMF